MVTEMMPITNPTWGGSELLWTNTSQTSSMSAQTLSNIDLTPYTFILVYTNAQTSILIPINYKGQLIGITYTGTTIIGTRRTVEPIRSTSSIKIYDADRITQGSGKTTDNAQQIPLLIYGVR